MQPATADRQALEGRPIPYRWATPGQQAQAVLWLADKLRYHFPTLSVTGWSQAFHAFQPDLWEDNAGIGLDYGDLGRFAQRLADSSLVPDLDPPICCADAGYLAEVYAYLKQVATGLRPELEASPLAHNLELMALIERLEVGNAVAERVLRDTRRLAAAHAY